MDTWNNFYDLIYLSRFLSLTPKHMEMYGCVLRTVATDALVLKHQAIIIPSSDEILIVSDQFYTNIIYIFHEKNYKITLRFKKLPSCLSVN